MCDSLGAIVGAIGCVDPREPAECATAMIARPRHRAVTAVTAGEIRYAGFTSAATIASKARSAIAVISASVRSWIGWLT